MFNRFVLVTIILYLLTVGCGSLRGSSSPATLRMDAEFATLPREQLMAEADLILVGEVVAVSQTGWNQDSGEFWEATMSSPNPSGEFTAVSLHTIMVQVSDVLRGEAVTDTVTITVNGMSPADTEPVLAGRHGTLVGEPAHRVQAGDELLLFLRESSIQWWEGVGALSYDSKRAHYVFPRRDAVLPLGDPALALLRLGENGRYHPQIANADHPPLNLADLHQLFAPAGSRTPPANKLGVHLLLDDGRNEWPLDQWPAHLQAAQAIVGEGGFVTQLVRLDDLDVVKWQQFMDWCAAYGLTPIIRLATVYDRQNGYWIVPPEDAPARYADFLAQLRWPTEQHVVVVGNEVNHGDEWGGVPDPVAYTRFLRETAVRLKAQDPQAFILNAPLDLFSPNTRGEPFVNEMVYWDADSFLDAMWQADPDIFALLDGWASHPYPVGPFKAPPEQSYHAFRYSDGRLVETTYSPPSQIHNHGIQGYEWELWKLNSLGVPSLPVFITETGWRHGEGWVEMETAVSYLTAARDVWLADDRVYAITPFALNGHPSEWTHTSWLGMDETGQIVDVYPLASAWAGQPVSLAVETNE